MVLETISTLFTTLGSAASTARTFKDLLQSNKGDARMLLEELKKNSTLTWLVVERQVAPARIIPQLSTAAYDRLLAKNYNFNELSPKKKKLAGTVPLEGSDLASFIGKDVAVLVESIYDRIKEMQLILQVDPSDGRIDWNRRVINLHKRILLLMLHLRGVLSRSVG
jgi:hypothetical protein